MLTGLLFGQESTIVLKDGKTIKGTIVSEEEYEYTVQVVKVYGYSRYEKIKILKSDIVTIESEIDTTQEEDKGTNIDSDTQKLFVQDVLLHKSGEVYKGTYIGKVDEDIVFKIEERSSTNKFPINDVDIIKTINGEYYYPFDIPTKEVFNQNTKSSVFNSNILPKNFVSKQEIINMSEDEKGILYGKYKVSPIGNALFSFFIPTLGYYRINQWRERGRNCIYIYFASAMALQLAVGVNNVGREVAQELEITRKETSDVNEIGGSFAGIFIALHLFDVYEQTKKYNRNLNKYIFGQEAH